MPIPLILIGLLFAGIWCYAMWALIDMMTYKKRLRQGKVKMRR